MMPRKPADNPAKAPGAKEKSSWQAIRISQIPSSIQRDEFAEILQDLNEGGEGNVLSWSFCPDATTCYEDLYSVATVELRQTPQWLSKKTGRGLWETKYGTFVADMDFLGLTPLSSPPRNDTAVE
jgi:hypothetical protein